jgi:Protein of unknown function (DUF3307)
MQYELLPLGIIAAHMLGDFPLQTSWMAENKLKSWYARAVHVSVYSIPFVVVAFVSLSIKQAVIFLPCNWIIHYVIDSKRWYINKTFVPGTIIADQAFHLASLWILLSIVIVLA